LLSVVTHRPWVGLVLALAGSLGLPLRAFAEEEVDVCVVSILASETSQKVDRKLECLAKEVRKREPKLTGFRVAYTACNSLAIGASYKFPLLEDQVAPVEIYHAPNQKNRVSLKIKAPGVGEISYDCACGKYFPIVTHYQTKDKERLIIAVMCKSCPHDK
jgi:hypothetical protein